MSEESGSARRAPLASRAGPGLAALLAAAAYLPALWPAGDGRDFDALVFRPGALPGLAVVALAVFAASLRLPALRRLGEAGAPRQAAGLAVIGTALYVWALLTGADWLLLAALALHGLALARASRRGACALLAGPALILLLGTPLPRPLEDELVWQLQRASAVGAEALLEAAGHDFLRIAVTLHGPDHSFHVIDGCSGLSGILILGLVALVIRELFPEAGRRGWALLALAPPLGFALNAVRVAYIASSPGAAPDVTNSSDHTAQGMAVLMSGSVLLYLAGWGLACLSPRTSATDAAPRPAARAAPWGAAAVGFAGLFGLWLVVPRFAEAEPRPAPPSTLPFPAERAAWQPGELKPDLAFTGLAQPGLQRRYHLPAGGGQLDIVDLMVGYERPGPVDGFQLLSSKLVYPGPNWARQTLTDAPLPTFGREVTRGTFARGRRGAVSISWRLRDCGLACETLRAWLALDASPLRRARPRAAVRVVAYAQDTSPYALTRAREVAERFLREFRPELQEL